MKSGEAVENIKNSYDIKKNVTHLKMIFDNIRCKITYYMIIKYKVLYNIYYLISLLLNNYVSSSLLIESEFSVRMN